MTGLLIPSRRFAANRTAKIKLRQSLRNALAHCWMPVVYLLLFYNFNALIVLINSRFTLDSSKSLLNNAGFLGIFFESLYISRTVKSESILCVLFSVPTQKFLLFFFIALDTVVYVLIFLLQLEFAYKRINFAVLKLLSFFDSQYEVYVRVVLDNSYLRFLVLYLSSISNLLFGLATKFSSNEGVIFFSYDLGPNFLGDKIFLFYLLGAFTRYTLALFSFAGIVLKQFYNKEPIEANKKDELSQFELYMLNQYKTMILENYSPDVTIRIAQPGYVIKVQPQKFLDVRFFESRKYICLNEINKETAMDIDYIIRRVQYKYNKMDFINPPCRNPFAKFCFYFLSLSVALNVIFGLILWVVLVGYHNEKGVQIIMLVSLAGPIITTVIAVFVRRASEKIQPVKPIRSAKPLLAQTSILKDKLTIISSDKTYDNSTDLPSTERQSLFRNSDDTVFSNKLLPMSAKVHPLKSKTRDSTWSTKHSY